MFSILCEHIRTTQKKVTLKMIFLFFSFVFRDIVRRNLLFILDCHAFNLQCESR